MSRRVKMAGELAGRLEAKGEGRAARDLDNFISYAKRLEAQLRIAKRALKSWADYIPMHPDLDTLEDVQEDMRQAARRKLNG